MNHITFRAKKYPVRILEHKEYTEVMIATTDLSEVLITGDGEYYSNSARVADRQIYYFRGAEEITLPGYRLRQLIEHI